MKHPNNVYPKYAYHVTKYLKFDERNFISTYLSYMYSKNNYIFYQYLLNIDENLINYKKTKEVTSSLNIQVRVAED